jgi:hypothetical protein
MATPTVPRNPRRSAAELTSGRSRISVVVSSRPKELKETAGRKALRSALASSVWVINDIDAYAAELDIELAHS